MKKLLVIYVVVACALTAHALKEGVGNRSSEGVGNGKREGVGNRSGEGVGNIIARPVFSSSTNYKETSFIKFDQRLSFTPTAERTTITNAPLNPRRVSTITFELLRNDPQMGSIKTTQQLISHLRSISKAMWKDVQVGGAEGYVTETSSNTHLNALYYVITTNGDLLKISINAFAEGQGFALVAPIVKTMSVDVTAPRILEMKLHGDGRIAPGQTVRVLVRAIDELSGINVSKDNYHGSVFSAGGEKRFHSHSVVTSLGRGWYAYDYFVPQNVEKGEYTFDGVTVVDNAENTGRLWVHPWATTNFYVGQTEFLNRQPKTTTISHLKITVTRDGSDVMNVVPLLSNIRTKTESVKAGENVEFLFHVPNTEGFEEQIKTHHVPMGFIISFAPESVKRIDIPYDINGVVYVTEAKGWYIGKFQVNRRTPPGEYYLNRIYSSYYKGSNLFSAEKGMATYRNNGTEQTQIPIAKFTVLPDDRADKDPPEVQTIRTEGSFGPRGNGAVLLQMFDAGSGVDDKSWISGYFTSVEKTQSGHKRFHVANKRYRPEVRDNYTLNFADDLPAEPVPGWYRMIPQPKDYLPEGEYYLDEIRVEDKAKNYLYLRADLSDGLYHKLDGLSDLGAVTNLPIIRIQYRR